MRGDIGILTFHRCVNYGSYWQARCLLEWVRRRGRNAVLLDHVSLQARRAELRCALSPHLPQPTRAEDIPAYVRKVRGFRRAVARLPLSPRFPLDSPAQAQPCDVVLVGSDEIFNLHHPWYGGTPAFFGEGFSQRRVAYAASFGNQTVALDAFWSARLANFAALSVRDRTALALVSATGLPPPELVLDPCLLNPPVAPPVARRAQQNFVVVYGHGFPHWFAEAARFWAGAKNMRLVSVGYRNDWADEQRIDADPETFRDLMASCAAVATDFFHGCVFAVLNRKPFACVATSYRHNKLRDLCALLGLDDRLAAEASAVPRGLSEPPAGDVHDRVVALRARSECFLDLALAP
ncbi:Polysaccharide pyruvyl transferase family protein WcaK [Rhodoblastus acidophilus]|uniref:Polysaccharide pyruvyl transferase family protein WcaK n=1 Tax=Rhodoblastus acidophilus TaxID=1074 RepID=A0A212RQ34_RHOAC|nr:polysaccharide pyruvyl transferase family protein [Rhodoblastus acidophilus]PPQ38522.1 polysaccharide pyruvyl transferase family protein [Rhodoblastus acidophilus]RAI21835.1 polysaccharide pyruvyl transferase family protein [Rhodoblastus acidophilus]SNB74683.1 Polysaccharide pyruvyl transferase family protein WcaK [Rhodoblastus acidophilus]